MFNFFRKPKTPTPKASLDNVDLDLSHIPGAVEVIDGFPRVHWSKVGAAADAYRSHPAIDQIWAELAAQWLGILQTQLGKSYQIYESDHLLLLSSQTSFTAKHLLKVGDEAYERVRKIIKPATQLGFGKHVVLLLHEKSIYYDYISYFYPDTSREFGASGGMHISRGYRHTVINGTSSGTLRTLVHELSHDAVFDRPLPRWLNEGLAKFMEDMVPEDRGYRRQLLDSRQVRLQQRYWSWFGMDHFWNGEAFFSSSSQRISYQLAEVLFRNMAGDRVRGRNLEALLAAARRDDAGASACQQYMGCSLSELVEEFLGPGNWEPKPQAVKSDGN